jgi:hypothetical protein
MRHHPHHIAAFAADSGDVAQRTVGVIEITHHDTILGFERVERALIRKVTSLTVRDRHFDELSFGRRARERRIGGFDADGDGTAYETEIPVAQPPSCANFFTAAMTGENFAMAPQRR